MYNFLPIGNLLVVTTFLLSASHDKNIPSVSVVMSVAYNTSALSDTRKNELAVRGVLKVEPLPLITSLLAEATCIWKEFTSHFKTPSEMFTSP